MTAPRDVHPWDLWILRALDPLAGPAEVRALRSARAHHRARERALRVRLLAGDRTPLAPGRSLFAARPDLARGMVLTMRLGPYPCVLEPFLDAGCDVAAQEVKFMRRHLILGSILLVASAACAQQPAEVKAGWP